jgi:hypothetical protein
MLQYLEFERLGSVSGSLRARFAGCLATRFLRDFASLSQSSPLATTEEGPT